MMYAETLVNDWIRRAPRETLLDKLADLDPSNDRVLSPRDVETRAILRAKIRAEVKRRDSQA